MHVPLSLNRSAQMQAHDFLFGDLDIQLGAARHCVDVVSFRPVASRPAQYLLTTSREARVEISQLAYELGWDLSHHGMHVSSEMAVVPPAAAQGWEAGWKHFADRRRAPDGFERKWLRLRCRELEQLRGMHEGVTPKYIRSLASPFCPVLRSPLSYETGIPHLEDANTWTMVPLDKEGGFRPGNLVVMSGPAKMALRRYRYDHLRVIATIAARNPGRSVRGLTSEHWLRLAYLASMAEPMHRWRETAQLPMRVLPAPWLASAHPFAKLQATLSVLPCKCSKAEGRRSFAALFMGKTQQQVARAVATAFFAAAGAEQSKGGNRPWAWIAEDAWETDELMHHWGTLVQSVGEGDFEALTQRVAAGLSDDEWRSAVGGGKGVSSM